MREAYLKLIDCYIHNTWTAYWMFYDIPPFEQYMHKAKRGVAYYTGAAQGQLRAARDIAKGANVLSKNNPEPTDIKVEWIMADITYDFDPNGMNSKCEK